MTKDFFKEQKNSLLLINQFTSYYAARVGTTFPITESGWTQLSFNMSFLNDGALVVQKANNI